MRIAILTTKLAAQKRWRDTRWYSITVFMAEENEKTKKYWIASGLCGGIGLSVMLAIQDIIDLLEQYFEFTAPLLLVQSVIIICVLSIAVSVFLALVSAWSYSKPKKTKIMLTTIFIVLVLLIVALFIFNQKDYKGIITAQHKTLLELFHEDSFGQIVLDQDLDVVIAEEKMHVLIKKYILFYANANFFGVYVPKSTASYEFISRIPEEYERIFDFDVFIEAQEPSEIYSTNTKNITFTGRIYVYHEDFLTNDQQHKLYDIYKKKGLSLVLRGQSYLANEWIYNPNMKHN